MEARVGLGMHGLDARRIIDMRHGGNVGARHLELLDAEEALLLLAHAAPAALDHVGHHHHVGTFALQLEPLRHLLAQHRGCERPEGLAVLDLEVECRLHRRASAHPR